MIWTKKEKEDAQGAATVMVLVLTALTQASIMSSHFGLSAKWGLTALNLAGWIFVWVIVVYCIIGGIKEEEKK